MGRGSVCIGKWREKGAVGVLEGGKDSVELVGRGWEGRERRGLWVGVYWRVERILWSCLEGDGKGERDWL